MYNKVKESLVKFMDAWKEKDWIVMYKYVQMSWQMNHPQLVTELPPCQQYLDGIKVLGYKIGSAHKSSDFAKIFKIPDKLICVDVDIKIDYLIEGIKKIGKKEVKIRMVCEKDAYNLSEKGKWGVNVLSVLKKSKEIKNGKS
jgi:hypothetical protein